jgi:hypothetical protein
MASSVLIRPEACLSYADYGICSPNHGAGFFYLAVIAVQFEFQTPKGACGHENAPFEFRTCKSMFSLAMRR